MRRILIDPGHLFRLKPRWIHTPRSDSNPIGQGSGGFTTHDLHRCQLAARAVALIYNWWSLFVRLANPEARREAITSRPWLMSSVGRRTEHAGQTTITLTGLHAHFEKARAALMLSLIHISEPTRPY